MHDLPLPLLRTLLVLCLGGSVSALLARLVTSRWADLARSLGSHREALARDLAFLRAPVSASSVLMVQGALLALAAACVLAGHPLVASLSVLCALSVRSLLHARRVRRTNALDEQLDGFLRALASSLRASPALGDALEQSVALVASPLREELALLVAERGLGTPLDAALERLGTRVGSRTLHSALAALRIGRATGGDLSTILERSAATLREMARLEGVLRTKTAEAKAQAFVLAALPLPLIALLHHLNPQFLAPLFQDVRGHAVLGAAALCWGASIVLARSILHVDL